MQSHMECQAAEKYRSTPQGAFGLWLAVKTRFAAIFRPSLPALPLETMSDYMKRDLGFLDGRGSWNDPNLRH